MAEGLVVLGPAPAPFAYLRGKHRQRLLLRAEKSFNIQAYLREWLPRVPPSRYVRVAVDIDPYSFL
jgi:primosomal protein N' (replication factor Y)